MICKKDVSWSVITVFLKQYKLFSLAIIWSFHPEGIKYKSAARDLGGKDPIIEAAILSVIIMLTPCLIRDTLILLLYSYTA